MRTLTEKYNAVLEGKFAKAQFVRDARLSHPNFITQFNGFEDTVTILKNKGLISEAKSWMMGKDYPAYGQVVDIEKEGEKVHVTFLANDKETTFTFVEDPDDRDKWIEISESLNEEIEKYKADKSPEYQYISNTEDMFSFETIERAIDAELDKKGFDTVSVNFTREDYEKAKKQALKNLQKDPNFYLYQLAGEKVTKKRTDVMKPVEKDNFVDKDNAMKKEKLKEGFKKLIVSILREEQENNTNKVSKD